MTTNKTPLYLLDVLKLLTLFSIVTLHSNEFIFFTDHAYWGLSAPFYFAGSLVARAFSIGGQILIMLIYLLYGLRDKMDKSLKKLSLLAFFGQIILTLIFMGEGHFFSVIEWDIYSYIFFTSCLLILLPHSFRKSVTLMTISFLILWIPTSFLKDIAPESVFWRALTGYAFPESTGSWPLIPWFFHALLFFQLGIKIREGRIDLAKWYKGESYLWPVILLLAIPQLGAYYWLPIGPNYYRFVFNQTPLTYWSNFIIFVFIVRVSFLIKLQEKLGLFSIIRWISSLYWCRKVGLLYFISIIYIGLGTFYSDDFKINPWAYDLFYLSIMPVCELLGRLLVRIFSRVKIT